MSGQWSQTRSRVDDLLARIAADPTFRQALQACPADVLASEGLVSPAEPAEVVGYMPPRCTFKSCLVTCQRSDRGY